MEQLTIRLSNWLDSAWSSVSAWVASPEFYAQLAAILAAVVVAFLLSGVLRRALPVFQAPPEGRVLPRWRVAVLRIGGLLFPLLNILLLGVCIGIAEGNESSGWLLRIAQGLAVVFLLYSVLTEYISNTTVSALARWTAIPVAVLHVFGVLGDVTAYLDGMSLSVGDIRVSLFALLRTLVFGALLFWLGRVSNSAGKRVIRGSPSLSIGSKEVFVKLFEIAVFVVVFLLLLQVMGINLTALAVFGGALGVGLGFGLQQIASNFVSGIIILLDRSVAIGDFLELEDGRSGYLRELNMRYGVIESFDGKDVVIPNEAFITSSYTNWTHKDPRQRYPLNFQVAYSTDLDLLFDNIREICAEHPSVISGDDLPLELRPDAEIAGFGDSGIDILVEFWIDGIDDGKNRVGADLLHSIWRSIQENGMQIPFPQREVRIIGGQLPVDLK